MSTKAAIDDAFDTAEKWVDAVGSTMGVDMRDEAPKHATSVTALPSGRATLALASAQPAPATFTARKAVDVVSKRVSWIVSDGANATFTCADEATAKAVLAEIVKQGGAA